MANLLFIVLLALTAIQLGAGFKVDKEIVNKNVDRTIDIASQLVKINYKITVEHSKGKPVTDYVFFVPEAERNHLSYISIKDTTKKELKPIETATSSGVNYAVALPSSQNSVVYIETVYAKMLNPHPALITQADKQLVQYFGNAYFYSPYKTVTQKTTIHLASRNVESYTTVKPSSHSDTTITYGSYDNIEGM